MIRPPPKPPKAAVTSRDLEVQRRKTLNGWVVGWGNLFLDDDGWLDLRDNARVFRTWIHAFWASWLFPVVPIPFYGWPRRNRRPQAYAQNGMI